MENSLPPEIRAAAVRFPWLNKHAIFLCTNDNLEVKIGGYAHDGHKELLNNYFT